MKCRKCVAGICYRSRKCFHYSSYLLKQRQAVCRPVGQKPKHFSLICTKAKVKKCQQLKDNRKLLRSTRCSCQTSALLRKHARFYQTKPVRRLQSTGLRRTDLPLHSAQGWKHWSVINYESTETAEETLCHPKPSESWPRVRQIVSPLRTRAAAPRQRLLNKTKLRRQMNIHDMTFARSSSQRQPVALHLNGHNSNGETLWYHSRESGCVWTWIVEIKCQLSL